MAHTIQAVIKCHGAAAVVPLAHAQVKVMYSADYMANQINVQVVAMPALGVAAATTKVGARHKTHHWFQKRCAYCSGCHYSGVVQCS